MSWTRRALARWREAPVVLRVVALALVCTIAFSVVLGVEQRRIMTERNACASSCHVEQLGGASHRGHQDMRCTQCHALEPELALSLAASMLLGTPPPSHGSIDDRPCEQCHDARRDSVFATAAKTSGHRAHASGAARTACVSCHGPGEHRGIAGERVCTSCHARASVHDEPVPGAESADRCTVCHAFVGDAASPIVDACAGCHAAEAQPSAPRAASVVSATVLHGDVSCASCHDAHAHPGAHPGGTDAARDDCNRCHAIDTGDDALGPAGHHRCQGCHAPHAPTKDSVVACSQCHDEGRARPKAARDEPLGQEPGTRSTALEHDDCSSCHEPHRWLAERAGCVKCHSEQTSVVLASAPEPHQRCTACHPPHQAPPSTGTCLGCHRTLERTQAAAPAGHANCTGCHDAHRGVDGALGACSSCHASELQELASVREHGDLGCRGCHDAHGGSRMPPGRCDSCHKGEARGLAAAPPEHRRCEGCHASHAFAVTSPTQACSKCHATLAAARGSHKDACHECHEPHGSPLVELRGCVDCHDKIDAKAVAKPGHRTCSGCHEAHQPATVAENGCARCHDKQQTVAASWPAGSAHRGPCSQCHAPHDVDRGATCQGCHVDEARHARGAAHRCEQCHAPHRSPPDTGARQGGQLEWWGRCAGCHEGPASAVADRGARFELQSGAAKRTASKHGACASCHRPHDERVAQCNDCHQVAKLAGHAVSAHRADCNRCHDEHERRTVGRAECLECHQDMKLHQPGAPRCQSCHLFR